ncbi:MAG: hypothetical protein RL637_831, partial [Pseudomonadota bacterium]
MTHLIATLLFAVAIFTPPVFAKEFENHTRLMEHGEHGEGHLMDMGGAMVMGNNTDTLPGGCNSISEVKEITVHAGHKYAEKFPGTMFAFDTQNFQFEPCTKLTVHFINDDDIRHQWMMHGLPKYLYPKGMFHLEVSGPGEVSGTLILPADDKTYLVHCDIAQHMEKGMKAQLKVGKGSGDLPSIPGVSPYIIADDYRDISSELPEIKPTINPANPNATADNNSTSIDSTISTQTDNISSENNNTLTDNPQSLISGVTMIGLAIGFWLAPILRQKLAGKTMMES